MSSFNRIDKDVYMLSIARLVSLRSTCQFRTVGCVLTDDKHHVLATGYNGGLPSEPHCIDHPCKDVLCEANRGSRSGFCSAIHAESNALFQIEGSKSKVTHVYVTDSPCYRCARDLCRLPCLREVHYVRYYTDEGLNVLFDNKIKVVHHKDAYTDGFWKWILSCERPQPEKEMNTNG